MKLNYIVRLAKQDDIKNLIDLRKLLLNQGKGHYVATSSIEQQAWTEHYAQWLKKYISMQSESSHSIAIIVASLEDTPRKIIGCVTGIIDERAPMPGCLNGRMGWIQSLVVEPNYRKQGVAQQLMHHLEVWFKTSNITEVCLQTTHMAKSLYSRRSFKDTNEALLIKSLDRNMSNESTT